MHLWRELVEVLLECIANQCEVDSGGEEEDYGCSDVIRNVFFAVDHTNEGKADNDQVSCKHVPVVSADTDLAVEHLVDASDVRGDHSICENCDSDEEDFVKFFVRNDGH